MFSFGAFDLIFNNKYQIYWCDRHVFSVYFRIEIMPFQFRLMLWPSKYRAAQWVCHFWSAFSWHHSSGFQCQWTPIQVFSISSNILSWKCKRIHQFMWRNMYLIQFHISELTTHFVSRGSIKLGATNRLYWSQLLWSDRYDCAKWPLSLQHCDILNWDKHSCVPMTWHLGCAFLLLDLKPLLFTCVTLTSRKSFICTGRVR